jgi:hypothetical protein
MNKIDLDRFQPKERQWVLEFQQILENFDLANLTKHQAMIQPKPRSAIADRIELLKPCVDTLLAYGVPGVEAVYRVAMSTSYGYIHSRWSLIGLAEGDPHSALKSISRTERYINDAARQRLIES